MTASAQVSNRPAARTEKFVSGNGGSVRAAALARSLPAPPAPAPQLAPPARSRQVAPAACGSAVAPESGAAEPVGSLVGGSGRVARVAVAVAVTLAVVGGLTWIGQGAHPGIPAETVVTRVGAGETVWDVARRVAPQSDQGAVVERIRQLNGIVGSAVQPDQQLRVPDGRNRDRD